MHNPTDPDQALGATTAYLLSEVKRRGIPYRRFGQSSLIMLGYGSKQRMLRTAVTDSTSGLGIEMAGDKDETKQILAYHQIPVPKGYTVYDEEELKDAFSKMRLPIVVKPLDGNHGRGVTTHIDTIDKALFGFHLAKEISDAIIVEEFLEGDDHRFLVINYKLVAVAKRTPAMITGDGVSTIQTLIEKENTHPDRGHSSEHVLAPIEMDEATIKILSEKKLNLQSVLPLGEQLYVKDTANISAGGTATDVTDLVHPYNKFLAERVAKIFKLDICGIDIITKDVAIPLESAGGIIEVNAGPGLRMHSNPTIGEPRNVAGAILDMLFPERVYHIPVIGTFMTENADNTLKLLAQIGKQKGLGVGYGTEAGFFINDIQVANAQFPDGVGLLIYDPSVDIMLVDCKKAYSHSTVFTAYDIVIMDEVSYDSEMIHDVIHKIPADGYLITNSDDPNISAMLPTIDCHKAFFGKEMNDLLKEHIAQGGLCIINDGIKSILYQNGSETVVDSDYHSGNTHTLFDIGILLDKVLEIQKMI